MSRFFQRRSVVTDGKTFVEASNGAGTVVSTELPSRSRGTAVNLHSQLLKHQLELPNIALLRIHATPCTVCTVLIDEKLRSHGHSHLCSSCKAVVASCNAAAEPGASGKATAEGPAPLCGSPADSKDQRPVGESEDGQMEGPVIELDPGFKAWKAEKVARLRSAQRKASERRLLNHGHGGSNNHTLPAPTVATSSKAGSAPRAATRRGVRSTKSYARGAAPARPNKMQSGLPPLRGGAPTVSNTALSSRRARVCARRKRDRRMTEATAANSVSNVFAHIYTRGKRAPASTRA